jgi:hypothetical protein
VRSSWRTAFTLIAGLAVAAFVMMVIWWINRSRHPVDTATIVAADLAAAGIAVTLLMALGAWWRKGRADTTAGASKSAQAAAAADRLGEVMADRWRLEAARRRIITPAPAMVRWRWAADTLTAQRVDVATPPVPGTGPMPLPDLGDPGELLGSGVVTRLHDEVYAKLPHGRLVLVGGPGAGKTGGMILLLLAALASRDSLTDDARAQVPVPVWLTLGGWDPDTKTLQEWTVSTIYRDHPFLRAPDYGSDVAAELLRRGLVALFFDGLDEMPEGTRGQALRRIDDEARSLRVVVTSRTEEYRYALEASRLDNTAVIELRPIRPAAAAAYLLRGQAGSGYQRWETLAAHIRLNPDSVAAGALDNPLTLSLARDAYASRNPAVLADTGKFATVEMIRAHLVDQALVTAYPDERQRVHATQWLAWIASHMGTNRDLLWWYIPTWVAGWQLRLAAGVCAWLCAGACTGLWLWFWTGIPGGFALGRGFGYGLGFGLAAGLVAGLLPRKGAGEPRTVVVRRPRWHELGRILQVEVGLVLACIFAAGGLAFWANKQETATVAYALASVLILLVLSIPVMWLPFGFLRLWATPVANSPSATPVGTYRSDRRASMIHALAVGLAAGLTPVVLVGLFGGWSTGLVFGLALLAVGFLAGLAWGRVPMVWVAQVVLACQGRGGVHFLHLLEDAFDRQLLRQAGTVYQFRHAALQDHLAGIRYHPKSVIDDQVAPSASA